MEELPPWEVLLREKLEAEIPEGIYSIFVDGKKMLTGRGGVIDEMVEKEREARLNEKK